MVLFFLLSFYTSLFEVDLQIISDRWSQKELDDIIHRSSLITDTGKKTDFLSGQFLDIKYEESTLTGDIKTPESLVINLKGVDCFTFLDYMEALRSSASLSEFGGKLIRVRYRSGIVSFENRNHFFTDWMESNRDFIEDVTEQLGSGKIIKVQKTLNQKGNGAYLLPGIPPKQREIKYIPSGSIDAGVIRRLRTGDYAGIYSDMPGLDVSHTGIIIRRGDSLYLRHASSRHGKVVDEDFKHYIYDKPGLIVLRPKK